MPRTVTVGLDGSPESRAAAEWAAREAELLGAAVQLVHVWEPVPEPMALAPVVSERTHLSWTERVPREAAQELRRHHPDLDVTTEQLTGVPAQVLAETAGTADLLVLGSRALGGLGGFLVGSVSLSVVAHARQPVVLVRSGNRAGQEHTTGGKDSRNGEDSEESEESAGPPSAEVPFRPVVLGLDTRRPDPGPIEFAFEAALRRGTSLRVVHGWYPPPYYGYAVPADAELYTAVEVGEAAGLTEALRPWRQKYPDVAVEERSAAGSPARLLVEAAEDASLVVVGRRVRRNPLGAHIGHVTHAVLHHATAPVAVVAHD
ncbi:universal stress protein [Streptomyces sp. SID10815]|uniref:universal stress protein n=1 Tax=Streptomyces sp. SID10815 TaxID=2706027 RepID=UPI0013C9DB2E|nr:universal stress protein [Streptomyces sp. SID10815]NEA51364.1 universal stress protein [Streptomyces sp. SID10815]